ncbi:DUF3108 domain-containing protein [Anaeromyxobacter oryzisoli]|uniref:DUF3108 domain-containing protein n=1 Tax=Anaeromyxobacter oryzisoli TaxID=2925408 RepID=UPI001F57F8A7|nr:DUF3108 domain-containing protein [Anaeromyxobacter sp. SG63]
MLGSMLALTLSLAAAVPYAPDEQMDFSIDYLGVTMGRARIAVGRPEGGFLPVMLLARTTGAAAVIDVREQLSSVLDVNTGLPRLFTLDAVEPGYRHTDTARFDRKSNRATVREKGKYDNTYDITVPPGTVDFVALVFQLRTRSLEPGTNHVFPVLFGRKVSRVTATVEGREKVSTPAGEFSTVKVRVPTGLTGKFSEKNPTYVWFSDDARRIVVRLSTDFAIGRAEAELSAYRPGKEEAAAADVGRGQTAPR